MAEGKSPAIVDFLNSMSKQMFGRSRSDCIASKVCVTCGEPATEFNGPVAAKEYTISGMCQSCQDNFFDAKDVNEGEADGNYVNQD